MKKTKTKFEASIRLILNLEACNEEDAEKKIKKLKLPTYYKKESLEIMDLDAIKK